MPTFNKYMQRSIDHKVVGASLRVMRNRADFVVLLNTGEPHAQEDGFSFPLSGNASALATRLRSFADYLERDPIIHFPTR